MLKPNDVIDKSKLPFHTAFIIDGNGRWAKKRGFPRTVGHKFGVDAVEKVIKSALKLGLKQLSFFCFSTENWNRPKSEVDEIFNLLRKYIDKDLSFYKENNIKFITSGLIEKLPEDLVSAINKSVENTSNNSGMVVNLCINYGGRDDIVQAINKFLLSGKTNITTNDISNMLYTSTLKDPDLIIRTSGEQRLSNFFLFQSAYAELYFTKTFWPDFDEKELIKAILDFQSRNRRFGEIKE